MQVKRVYHLGLNETQIRDSMWVSGWQSTLSQLEGLTRRSLITKGREGDHGQAEWWTPIHPCRACCHLRGSGQSRFAASPLSTIKELCFSLYGMQTSLCYRCQKSGERSQWVLFRDSQPKQNSLRSCRSVKFPLSRCDLMTRVAGGHSVKWLLWGCRNDSFTHNLLFWSF